MSNEEKKTESASIALRDLEGYDHEGTQPISKGDGDFFTDEAFRELILNKVVRE